MLSITKKSINLTQTLNAHNTNYTNIYYITKFYKHHYQTLTNFNLETNHINSPTKNHNILNQNQQQLRIQTKINPIKTFSIITKTNLFNNHLYKNISNSNNDFLLNPNKTLDFNNPINLIQLHQTYLH